MRQTICRRTSLAICGLGLLLVTSCGGEGSIALPKPTRSATATSLPSRTASPPSPTRSPGGEDSETPPPDATDTPSPAESETPSKTPSPKPTKTPPSSNPASTDTPSETADTPSETASADETPPAEDTEADNASEDDGVPSWVWWLLAAAALAALLAAILVPRRRRRNAWRADLTAAVGEATWFARELLPQLQQASSTEQVAGGWQVGAGRVTVLEDQLTGLEASARDEADRAARSRLAGRGARRASRRREPTRDRRPDLDCSRTRRDIEPTRLRRDLRVRAR